MDLSSLQYPLFPVEIALVCTILMTAMNELLQRHFSLPFPEAVIERTCWRGLNVIHEPGRCDKMRIEGLSYSYYQS